ncbi:MAG: transposase [Pseudomonadota bacterium]
MFVRCAPKCVARYVGSGRPAGAADEAVQVVRDQVEGLAWRGARQVLLAALEDEVNVYRGRGWYERRGDAGPPGNGRREFRGYRNGTTPRRLTLGSGTVPLDVPRLRDIPAGQEAFESKILWKYQRRSDMVDETFMRLFIEGLATRDFEPALRWIALREGCRESAESWGALLKDGRPRGLNEPACWIAA